MSTNILDLIAQIETEIEESPRPKIGGGNRRMVDRDMLIDLIGDLRVTVPDEVRWAQTLLAEKENILAKAREEAETMVRDAKATHERLVSENDVYCDALERAEVILQNARQTAALISDGAKSYADDILIDLQRYLREYGDIIESNRRELKSNYVTSGNFSSEHPLAAEAVDDSMFEDDD